MEKYNLLISIDNSYIEHAKDLIYSIAINNNVFLNLYVIYDDSLSKDTLDDLSNFMEENNYGIVKLYYFDSKKYDFPKNIDYISTVTYFRLFAPFIIDDNIDRLLYLDCDIICTGDISSLYNMEFRDDIIIACENMLPVQRQNYKQMTNERLGLPLDYDYVNAGVLLINIPEYINYISTKEIGCYIQDKYADLIYQDQDVLNKLFCEKIRICNVVYNYQINTVTRGLENDDVVLVHYSEAEKPWLDTYNDPNKAKYYYYLLKHKGQYDFLYNLMQQHAINYANELYETIVEDS